MILITIRILPCGALWRIIVTYILNGRERHRSDGIVARSVLNGLMAVITTFVAAIVKNISRVHARRGNEHDDLRKLCRPLCCGDTLGCLSTA
jgi:hypothetical protein